MHKDFLFYQATIPRTCQRDWQRPLGQQSRFAVLQAACYQRGMLLPVEPEQVGPGREPGASHLMHP